jgi:hypothetical protein
MVLVEAGGVFLEVIGLYGRVDGQRRLRDGDVGASERDGRHDDGDAKENGADPDECRVSHEFLPVERPGSTALAGREWPILAWARGFVTELRCCLCPVRA